MARLVRDPKLESRTARATLKSRKPPYWRTLEPGLALGYRRGKTGGLWIARRYLKARNYETESLGIADDRMDADGATILSYSHAIVAARSWWLKKPSGGGIAEGAARPDYTVAEALDDYLSHLRAKGSRDVEGATGKIELHIRPAIGTDTVAKLTTKRLADFQGSLGLSARLGRSKRPVRLPWALSEDPHEALRARRATANRVMTVLKAALNLAYQHGLAESDHAWRRLKRFPNTDAPRVRWLTKEQIRALDSALIEPFRTLVHGALTTGARYSELCNMRAHDFDPGSRTIQLRRTKNGKHRIVYLNSEGLAVVSRAVRNREPSMFAFTKNDGAPWKRSEQARPMTKACKVAGIFPPVSFHDLRHTFGALLAQSGVPMRVIAEALGHADTRITEKHYAHLCPSYVADEIRRGLPAMNLQIAMRSTEQERSKTQDFFLLLVYIQIFDDSLCVLQILGYMRIVSPLAERHVPRGTRMTRAIHDRGFNP